MRSGYARGQSWDSCVRWKSPWHPIGIKGINSIDDQGRRMQLRSRKKDCCPGARLTD